MQPNDDFRGAVEDALMMWGAFNPQRHADAKTALNDLICIEQQVALDPSVSAEARKLQQQGVKDCRLCVHRKIEPQEYGEYASEFCYKDACAGFSLFQYTPSIPFWERTDDQSF